MSNKLSINHNNDCNLFNYIGIDVLKGKFIALKIYPCKDIHPDYDLVLYSVVSWNNGESVAKKKKIKRNILYLIDNGVETVNIITCLSSSNNLNLEDILLEGTFHLDYDKN